MSKNRHNWGHRNVWTPCEIYHPESLEELRSVIQTAAKKHSKIRPIGSLHSSNSLCATEGVNIDTTHLNRVLKIDKENSTVKVEGGIKIRTLLKKLALEGLTLPNQAYIQEQTIAGAIATATHGSTGHASTYSSFVVEIELIDAEGNIHNLTPDKDRHVFSGAVVNLGCLGVIYSLTLKCIPLKRLLLNKKKTTYPTISYQIQDYLKSNESFQISKDPYSEELIAWFYQKTEEEVSSQTVYQVKRNLIKLSAWFFFDIAYPPYWLMPYVSKMYLWLSPIRNCVNYSHLILSPEDEGHYIEEEIAVPFEHFETALAITQTLIKRFGDQKLRPTLTVIIRFVEPEPYGYLSPAKDKQTVYITMISCAIKGYEKLFHEWEEAMFPLQGRPHWGKIHTLNKEKVFALYGENFTKFLEVKQSLDPKSVFSNPFIDNIFY
jgi:FAD/FMN-containing dehydrogenase